jgi:glucose-1-phosphate thymidylyltransferase
VEKPTEHISDFALSGIYVFSPAIFAAAKSIQPSSRGELEITDAIQFLIDHGYQVRAQQITGWWKDTGKVEDLLEANRIMLDEQGGRIHGSVDEATHIVGAVVVDEGATVTESVIRGPVIIGRDAVVARSTLGPHVSVYDGSRIEDSEISDSIIMGGATISEMRPMNGSLIGTNVEIRKSDRHPTAFQFVIGDSSQVQVP